MPGEGGDLLRDRAGRLVERREDVPEARDSAVGQIIELDHPELDDLILLLVEAGGLQIDDHASSADLIGRRDRSRPGHQATKHAVVPGSDQCFG